MINTVRHKISVVVDLDRCPQRKHHRLSDLNEKRAEAFLHLPGDVETGFDRRKSAVKTTAAFAAWACQASSSVCRIGEGRAPAAAATGSPITLLSGYKMGCQNQVGISRDLLIWNELDRRGFVAVGFALDLPDLRHASERALDSFYESVSQFLRRNPPERKSAGRSIPPTGTRSSPTRPSPANAANRIHGRPSRATNNSTATGARCRPGSFAGKSWCSFFHGVSRSILRLRRARTRLPPTTSASSRYTAKLSTSTDGRFSWPVCRRSKEIYPIVSSRSGSWSADSLPLRT
jgi:hypothetical protein